MISITIKYRADESLVISIVSYRLYFIIYGRAKEISYFIEILLTDFFSFLCSFIKCYTIPYSSHSPNLAFLNQDTNGHILVDCQSPVHQHSLRVRSSNQSIFCLATVNPKYVAIVIIDVYDVVIFIIFCMNDIHIAKSFLLSVSVVEAS